MAQLFANGARAALSAGIAAGDTTLSIASGGALFPIANTDAGAVGGSLDWYKAVLDDGTNFEIVYIRTHTSASTSFTNVLRAREGTTALSFAAGAVLGVRVTAEDMRLSIGRERLTAARTYYVRTNGSDGNTGLEDSAGGAFLTIQKAIDTAYLLDINTQTLTIQVGSGSYAGGMIAPAAFTGTLGIYLVGNPTTPANVVLTNIIQSSNTAVVSVDGFEIAAPAQSFCLYAVNNGVINYKNIRFGAAGSSHIRASGGGIVSASGNYSIVASAPAHWTAMLGANVFVSNRTITLSGTPAFSTAFAATDLNGSMELYNNTYSGAATGVRYKCTMNGAIQTYTNATLPGNVAGTTATGGQYA